MIIGKNNPYSYKCIHLEDYPVSDAFDSGGKPNKKRVDLFNDPIWRICNLYTIIDRDMNLIPFRPNYPQRVLLYNLFILHRKRICIPKARQEGISTGTVIIFYDKTYWGKNMTCSIVDFTQKDATAKLDMVRISMENMNPYLATTELVMDNQNEIRWKTNSRVTAGKNCMGKTMGALHISEWGAMSYSDPGRSRGVLADDIPAASGPNAIIIAESTHKGGKYGDWFNIVNSVINVNEAMRTEADWTNLFFPWYMEPSYKLSGYREVISDEIWDYLEIMEREYDVQLDLEQKIWYCKKRETLGDEIWKQYPSSMDEMWKARSEGVIYAELLDIAIAQGRVNNNIRYDETLPVYASFDIGKPENTKCWLFQLNGDRIVFIESMSGDQMCNTPARWVKRLNERGYYYGMIILPHDGETLWKSEMRNCGMKMVTCIPRQMNIWDQIGYVNQNFSRFEFLEGACQGGLECLEAYHCKIERDDKTVREIPIHDYSSHGASALETGIAALHHGFIRNTGVVKNRASGHFPYSEKPKIKVRMA